MASVYIIDHSNFVYKFRSVHTYANIVKNGVSIDISPLVGYVRALKQNPFNDIIIALDATPQMSLDLLPGYKGQRDKDIANCLSVSKLEIVQFLTQIGTLIGKNIKVVVSPLQEADQCISSMVHVITNHLPPKSKLIDTLNSKPIEDDKWLNYLSKAECQSKKIDLPYDTCVIATTDSDMSQLQRFNGVLMDTSTSGKSITDHRVTDATHYLPAHAVPAYKAIFGDVSDNVPGMDVKNKSAIIKVLSGISSNEVLDEFIKCCGTSVESDVLSAPLKKLARSIFSSPQRSIFLRNLSITMLQFYSIPLELSFPSYSINDTIKKYGLRV